MSSSAPNQVSFVHTVLEGTPYQVGKLQAETLKNDKARLNYGMDN